MRLSSTIIYLVLTGFIFNESSYAQSISLDERAKNNVLQGLEDILKKLDSCHYHADMYFKEFGGDTFKIRNFTVSYQTNESNDVYGYDYEITELREQDTLVLITLDQSLYMVVTENKIVSERNLPDSIDNGNYFEYIRSSLVLFDILLPFLNTPSSEISVVDSNEQYYLHRRMNEFAVRLLVVNKQTFLPVKWSSIINNDDFDLTQTTEVCFDFGPDAWSLPATTFSIEKYLAAGYEHIVVKPDTFSERHNKQVLSMDEQNLLLNYPFILPDGDTVVIRDRTAKYLILDFWFASCLPCMMAFPELNHLSESYSELGLEILGINCFDNEIKENLSLKMRERNIQIPLLFGSKDLVQSLGISRFPSYYLITPERRFELINGGIEGIRKTIKERIQYK